MRQTCELSVTLDAHIDGETHYPRLVVQPNGKCTDISGRSLGEGHPLIVDFRPDWVEHKPWRVFYPMPDVEIRPR
jgi:hypothetical protein